MNNTIFKYMEVTKSVKGLLSCFNRKKYNLIQITGDNFDVKEALKGIRKNFDSKKIETFFSDDFEEAIKSLHMKTLFGGKLIIFYDIDIMPKAYFDEIKEVVERPETLKPNYVVLVYQGKKRVLKIKRSLIGKFKPVYDSDIPDWIKELVKEKGFSITREAINLLHFSCGVNREEINKYVDRIISIKGKEDKDIEEKDVRDIGFYRDDTMFKISNSVLEGKYTKALQYLVEYTGNGAIFHFINRDFRCLLTIKATIDEGGNLKSLNKKLRIHPYFFYKKYVPAAKRLPYGTLENDFDKVMDAEYKIKNGWEEFGANFNFVSQLQLGGKR